MISKLLFASFALIGVVFSQTCSDLINPSTGVSDCSFQISLCNNPVYYDLMTKQCPKTCGRCSTKNSGTNNESNTGTSSTCVDLTNPTTGISDCTTFSYLCNDAVYYSFMTVQCPKTCNRCPTSKK